MDSLLVAAGLGTLGLVGMGEYLSYVVLLALMVGGIQLLLGLLGMGFLVNFLSRPVISGFTSAAALIIIFSQLKHLLGVDFSTAGGFHDVVLNAVRSIPQTSPMDLAIGLSGILFLGVFKKWLPKFPGILIVVVLGLLAAYFFGLGSFGAKLVGSIPQGLPQFVMPTINLERIQLLFPIALVLALVGYMEPYP